MSPRYTESTRMLEFALDIAQRVIGSVSEMLPEEARHHLLNAQRELITALVIVYEQQAGTGRQGRRGAEPSGGPDKDFAVRGPRRTRGSAVVSGEATAKAPRRRRAAARPEAAPREGGGTTTTPRVPARRSRSTRIDVE